MSIILPPFTGGAGPVVAGKRSAPFVLPPSAGGGGAPAAPFTTKAQSFDPTDATSFTVPSATYDGSKVLILAVTGQRLDGSPYIAPQVTGLGGTWALQYQTESSAKRLFIFRTVLPTGATGMIVMDSGATNSGATINENIWVVNQVDDPGVPITNNGADAFGRPLGYLSRRDGNQTLTGDAYIQPLCDAANLTMLCLASFQPPQLEGTYTGIGAVTAGSPTNMSLTMAYQPGYDHNPHVGFGVGSDHFGYAFELRRTATARQAISRTLLTNDGSTQNLSNYTGATPTAHANKLVIASLVSVATGGSAGPSTVRLAPSSNFTKITGSDVTIGDLRITLWHAMFGSDTTGQLQVLHAAGQLACLWSLLEYDGTLTTGTNGSGAIGNVNVGSGAAGTHVGTTLSFADARNATHAAVAGAANWGSGVWPWIIPDLGLEFTRMANIDTGALGVNTPATGLLVLGQSSNNATPGATFPSAIDGLVSAVELKAA